MNKPFFHTDMNMSHIDSNPIIVFIHSVFPFGGAEKVTLALTPYLQQRGYDVVVITPQFRPDLLSKEDICPEIITLPIVNPCNSPENLEVVSTVIKSRNVKALICVWNEFSIPVELRHISSGCKYIYANHGQPLWEATSLMERKRKSCKTIKGLMIWIFKGRWIKYGLLNYPLIKTMRMYRRQLSDYDTYVVLCEEYRKELMQRLKVSGDKIVSIGNSIEIPEQINIDKEKIILYVGRLSYSDKRVDRLLRIWGRVQSEHQDWKLIIAGAGDERKNLEELSDRLNLERVEFIGYKKDLSSWYNRASILCLTSTFESWGLCLCEAQSYGVVPVAFDCSSGVHSILCNDSGILVSPFDEGEYAKALSNLMSDRSKMLKLQHNVINKASDYGPEKILAKWLSLIES